MKQFFIVLILYFTFFPLHAGPYYNRSTIKDGFNQFRKLDSEEQIKLLDEIKELIQEPDKDIIKPNALLFLTEKYDEETKKKYLIDLLKTYSLDLRQALFNETLNKALDYEMLFQNLTDEQCENVGYHINPKYINTFSIVDFFNCIHLPSFFQPTLKNTLIHREHYNMFNSFDQVGLWIEPFGHFTSFNQNIDQQYPNAIDPYYFNLNTLGISVGGEYTVTPPLVINMGLAYSYSDIQWKSSADSSLNTIYIGPSISYLLPYANFNLLFFGAINFYDMSRTTVLFPNVLTKKTSTYSKWVTLDLTGRFEGELSFPLKWGFYLYPLVKFDYFNIFIQKGTEILYKKGNLTVGSLYESFFESTVALKATKEIFKGDLGFIMPHVIISWVNYFPIQQSSYTYQIPGCTKRFKEEKVKNALISWSQCMIGIGVSFLYKQGIFLLFSYEFFTGNSSQTHFGKARVAWTW